MSEIYHFVINQQNVEKLQKMVDDVGKDLNTWIEVIYTPEELPPPVMEFAEMLWDKDIGRVVVVRSMEYMAQPME
jgi:2-hydroxy-3-keto-5-methylthiopentenyl-1-phosphate phosphatase